jgi:hypothetical protein
LKHVSVERAKAQRKCHRDGTHRIGKGERCLVVKEGTLAGSKNYCGICAVAILAAAAQKHAVLARDMGIAT